MKKHFLFFLSYLLLGIIFSGILNIPAKLTLAASTYYVATTGSDVTGNGSGGSPWQTIGYALEQVATGDTIRVTTGTYTDLDGETISLNNISLTGDGAATTIIQNDSTNATLNITGAGTIIAGLTFSGSSTNARLYIGNVSASDLLVQNNTFALNGGIGIQLLSDTTAANISNNTFSSSATGSRPINVVGNATNLTVSNNAVSSGSFGNIFASSGTLTTPTISDNTFLTTTSNHILLNGTSSNTTIINNTLANASDTAIKINAAATTPTITRNTIRNNAVSIDIEATISNALVSNNLIYSNTYGIMDNGNTTTAVFANNTINNNTNYGISFGASTSSGITLTNNIITNNGVSGIAADTSVSSAITSSYNNLYNNTASWTNVTQGTGDISQDPLFVSATLGSENFRLQASSPSINAGTTETSVPPVVSVTTDITGATRPYGSAYDQGAYENDNIAPSVSDRSPASGATSVARNTNISFTLTDNDTGVDTSAITLTVNGESVTPTVTAVSAPNSYSVSYNPSSDFNYGATITTAVTANDLASTVNTLSTSWSFTTIADTTAPAISDQSPTSGATSVAADTNISFTLTDSETGVDTSTLAMTVNGASVTPTVTAVSAPNSYSVSYNPSSDFTAGSTVTVAVSVNDLASTANTLSTSWSFTIQAAAAPSSSGGIAGGSSLSSSRASQNSSPAPSNETETSSQETSASSQETQQGNSASSGESSTEPSSTKKSLVWRIDPELQALYSEHVDDTDDPERLTCEGFTKQDLQTARALFRKIGKTRITVPRFIYALVPEIAYTVSDLADISIMVKSDLSEKRVSMKDGEGTLEGYLNSLTKKLDVGWGINIDHILIASREYFETHYFKTINLADKQSMVLDCPWMVVIREEEEDEQPPVEEEQPPVEEEQPPVEDEQPPVEDEQPPVEDEQPPVEEEQPPVEEEQQPPIDEPQPITEQETPPEPETLNEPEITAEPETPAELDLATTPESSDETKNLVEPETSVTTQTPSIAGGSAITTAIVAETPIETVTVSATSALGCDDYKGSADEDSDGLSDKLECVYKTDPKNAQTYGENLDSEIVIGRVDLLASTSEKTIPDAKRAFIAITNYDGAVKTASNTPLFRGVATPEDASVCLWAKNTAGDTKKLGCAKISPNQKFLFKTPDPLLDDTYTVTAKLVQFGTVLTESAPVTLSIYSSFDIDPPSVQKLGDVVIPEAIRNIPDQLKTFPIRLRMKRPALYGNAEYNNTVFIDWQSAIFSSALIADTGAGAFTSVTPKELETGDHSVWMYAVNPELGIRSDEVEVHFSIAETGMALIRQFAVQGAIAAGVIIGAILAYIFFFHRSVIKRARTERKI